MTIQNEGPEAKDLKRIADALDKLVMLQTSSKQPKPTQRKWETGIERDAEGNVQGFKPGGYTGDLKTQAKDFLTKLNKEGVKALKNEDEKPKDWQADTTELKREKNKLVVRIAAIESELKRRDQK